MSFGSLKVKRKFPLPEGLSGPFLSDNSWFNRAIQATQHDRTQATLPSLNYPILFLSLAFTNTTSNTYFRLLFPEMLKALGVSEERGVEGGSHLSDSSWPQAAQLKGSTGEGTGRKGSPPCRLHWTCALEVSLPTFSSLGQHSYFKTPCSVRGFPPRESWVFPPPWCQACGRESRVDLG